MGRAQSSGLRVAVRVVAAVLNVSAAHKNDEQPSQPSQESLPSLPSLLDLLPEKDQLKKSDLPDEPVTEAIKRKSEFIGQFARDCEGVSTSSGLEEARKNLLEAEKRHERLSSLEKILSFMDLRYLLSHFKHRMVGSLKAFGLSQSVNAVSVHLLNVCLVHHKLALLLNGALKLIWENYEVDVSGISTKEIVVRLRSKDPEGTSSWEVREKEVLERLNALNEDSIIEDFIDCAALSCPTQLADRLERLPTLYREGEKITLYKILGDPFPWLVMAEVHPERASWVFNEITKTAKLKGSCKEFIVNEKLESTFRKFLKSTELGEKVMLNSADQNRQLAELMRKEPLKAFLDSVVGLREYFGLEKADAVSSDASLLDGLNNDHLAEKENDLPQRKKKFSEMPVADAITKKYGDISKFGCEAGSSRWGLTTATGTLLEAKRPLTEVTDGLGPALRKILQFMDLRYLLSHFKDRMVGKLEPSGSAASVNPVSVGLLNLCLVNPDIALLLNGALKRLWENYEVDVSGILTEDIVSLLSVDGHGNSPDARNQELLQRLNALNKDSIIADFIDCAVLYLPTDLAANLKAKLEWYKNLGKNATLNEILGDPFPWLVMAELHAEKARFPAPSFLPQSGLSLVFDKITETARLRRSCEGFVRDNNLESLFRQAIEKDPQGKKFMRMPLPDLQQEAERVERDNDKAFLRNVIAVLEFFRFAKGDAESSAPLASASSSSAA